MDRITRQHLELLVADLNRLLGTPPEPWARPPGGGQHKACVGNYHLAGAYGKQSLEQMLSDGGGVRQIFGLSTKRELHDKLRALLLGINLARRVAKT